MMGERSLLNLPRERGLAQRAASAGWIVECDASGAFDRVIGSLPGSARGSMRWALR